MALDITATLAGLGGLTGGVVDNTGATDPVIIEAGVTLDGGLVSLLGDVLGTALGIGVQATLPNANVTNLGTVQGTTGAGIALGAGGSASNAAGATVSGTTGISVTGTAPDLLSTVNNLGAVKATGANGVGVALDLGNLTNGGTIASAGLDGVGVTIGAGSANNQAAGSIAGALDGLDAAGTAAVTNAGKILGTAGSGVTAAAGTVTNALGGIITGALTGVAKTGTGQVTNAGTISTTGANGIGVDLLNGGVVVDTGTISGSDANGAPGGVAVNLGGAGGSRLVLNPTAVLNGVAQATGPGNVLEIAAGTGATALKDIGTAVAGFDTAAIDPGAALNVAGGITAPIAVTLGDGSSLAVGGAVAAGASVDLGGTGTTLTIGDVPDFKGTIANLGADDTLDLAGLGAGTTVSYAPGTGLTITTPAGVSTVIPVTLPAGVSLGLSSDGLDVTVGVGGTGTSVTVGGGTTTPIQTPTSPVVSGLVSTTTHLQDAQRPFATAAITDPTAGATDRLTITPSGAPGTLSGAGLTANADGTYTLAAASPQTLTQELNALTFAPAGDGPLQSTSFALTTTSSTGAVGTATVGYTVDSTQNLGSFGTTATSADTPQGEVYALYGGLLGRAQDQVGAEGFVSALQSGTPLAEVTQGFLSSPEGQSFFTLGSSDADFVNQLYERVLGRAGDAPGVVNWNAALAGGESRADVADSFVFSAEHLADIGPGLSKGVFTADQTTSETARLYYGLLDRAPDAPGLQANTVQLDATGSMTALAQSFLNSAEYAAGHATPQSNADFVTSLYANALGRAPEQQGGAYWTGQLDSGAATRAQVAVGIAESGEATQHLAGRIENGFHLA